MFRRIPLTAALSALLLAGWAPAAERTEKGLTLQVPAEHAAMGRVYYVLPRNDAQITFTSAAPLEHIRAISNRVAGYVVVKEGKAGEAPAIVAAEFRAPIASFDTGIPMRNEHMTSPRWMDEKTYPDVVFTLTRVKDVNPATGPEGANSYTATVVGAFAVKGATKELALPVTVTFWPASDATKARAPGDLLSIRSQYDISLSDFGIGVGDPAMKSGKLADRIGIETFLMCSTVSPETPREAAPKPAGNQGNAGGAAAPARQ